jgi:hypothetical protein
VVAQLKYNSEEMISTPRGLRFNNPIFRYDYKTGDYFTRASKELYFYLFSTFAEITGGIRSAP